MVGKKKDTRKGNRHRPGYSTEYMRLYRARIKAQKLASGGPNKP
jgi:hypothetical protein